MKEATREQRKHKGKGTNKQKCKNLNMKMQMTFCDDKRKQILAERWMTLPVK